MSIIAASPLLNTASVNAQTALTYDEKFAIIKEVYDNVFRAMGMVETQRGTLPVHARVDGMAGQENHG